MTFDLNVCVFFYAAELCPPQDGYGQIMSLDRLLCINCPTQPFNTHKCTM